MEKFIRSKPKIALIVDTDDWAFANISKQIMKHLSYKYDFKYIPFEYVNNIMQVLFMAKDCDLIHFFWRGHINWLNDRSSINNYLKAIGIDDTETFLNDFLLTLNISTAVYDHLYISDQITNDIFKYVNHYYVSSKKLYNIYNKNKEIKAPDAIVTDGVDLDKFYSNNIDRFNSMKDKEIIIGWVGNSNWVKNECDYKGLKTIIEPAIKQLSASGYKIKGYFADKCERMIPHDEMNNYYSNIDIYVCASVCEGTPNPVLEAMAAGIPVISTDVGVVKDAFGVKQKTMIMEERTVECLKDKVLSFIKNPELFSELSKENIDAIKKWSWDLKTKQFEKYFDKCIK